MTRGLAFALFLVLGLGASPAARADQTDARLDGLFQRLKATAEEVEADAIEARIWQIWVRTEETESARLMREGILAMSRQAYADALARFDVLVEHAPAFAEAWNKRATVYYLVGDYAASVGDIMRTLELEPRHFGALSGLGLIYLELDEPAAALRSFEAALAINPHLEGARSRIDELRRRLSGRPT
ncbi:MAG TPA: tetratricopeptide repeat protein [Geminicoccaceae bacterium]|nr:tetratricopeptide repeat protein [Geminicoccaceae bacterium]